MGRDHRRYLGLWSTRKICLAEHYKFVMIGPDLQADNHGSEASAVYEVDRPQLVVERAAAALLK